MAVTSPDVGADTDLELDGEKEVEVGNDRPPPGDPLWQADARTTHDTAAAATPHPRPFTHPVWPSNARPRGDDEQVHFEYRVSPTPRPPCPGRSRGGFCLPYGRLRCQPRRAGGWSPPGWSPRQRRRRRGRAAQAGTAAGEVPRWLLAERRRRQGRRCSDAGEGPMIRVCLARCPLPDARICPQGMVMRTPGDTTLLGSALLRGSRCKGQRSRCRCGRPAPRSACLPYSSSRRTSIAASHRPTSENAVALA